MRIAYLFAESYPNYDIDFQMLSLLSSVELKDVDTLVRTGLWGLLDKQEGRTLEEIIQKRLVPLLCSGKGYIIEIKEESLAKTLALGQLVYTVQFVAIGRSLALTLHRQLIKYENYLGYVQVMVDLPLHQQVFGFCEPRYQLEHGKVYVLYSSAADNEFFADEIINHWKEKYQALEYIGIISSLKKRDTSFRYTLYDSNDGPSSDVTVQKALKVLGNLWELHAEQTLYRMQDAAPQALMAFTTALKSLESSNISSEEVAQIATSFRRTLEELTRQYLPPKESEKKPEEFGWVKKRWKAYGIEAKEKLTPYLQVILAEAIGIDDAIGHLESLIQMSNKGVHEIWQAEAFQRVALRLLLLIQDLMKVGPERKGVQLEHEFFLSILDTED